LYCRGNNLQENTKKKILAIELAILVVLSTVIVSINLDKLENVFSQPEKDVSDISQDVYSNEDEILQSTNENVIELIQQLDESLILGYLEKITSFGPHFSSSRTIEDVGDYIYSEFQSMGLNVRYQSWEAWVPFLKRPLIWHGRYNGKNIEATLQGTDGNSDEIFVIFAHYDGWRRSPAADDDGSGVAAVLAAAELMSKYEFNHTVRFVTLSGHEQGLLGSYYYAQEAVDNNDNIVAALCVDMIGYPGTSNEDNKVRVFENEQSRWITDFTINISQRYSEFLDLEVIQVDDPTGHASDYLNFWDFGLNTVFYHEIVMSDNRHTPKDTIENMDVPYATKISKLITATLAEFAWSDQSEWPDPSLTSMPINQQSVPGLQKRLEKFPILERILSSRSYFSRILRL